MPLFHERSYDWQAKSFAGAASPEDIKRVWRGIGESMGVRDAIEAIIGCGVTVEDVKPLIA